MKKVALFFVVLIAMVIGVGAGGIVLADSTPPMIPQIVVPSTPVPPQVDDIFQLFLNPGWNFISTPVQPQDPKITVVFQKVISKVLIVWGHDNRTKNWLKYSPDGGMLVNFDAGKGYWLYLSGEYSESIIIYGFKPARMNLYQGWNLVGYNGVNYNWNDAKSILDAQLGGNWSRVWTYNNEEWLGLFAHGHSNALNSFWLGKAYWIHTLVDSAWDPQPSEEQ
jgi:hypothetical protein